MAKAAPNVTPFLPDVPDVVQAWIKQIVSDDILGLLQQNPELQVEIRLYATGGKVRKQPVIVINGGPTESVSLEDL